MDCYLLPLPGKKLGHNKNRWMNGSCVDAPTRMMLCSVGELKKRVRGSGSEAPYTRED